MQSLSVLKVLVDRSVIISVLAEAVFFHVFKKQSKLGWSVARWRRPVVTEVMWR